MELALKIVFNTNQTRFSELDFYVKSFCMNFIDIIKKYISSCPDEGFNAETLTEILKIYIYITTALLLVFYID